MLRQITCRGTDLCVPMISVCACGHDNLGDILWYLYSDWFLSCSILIREKSACRSALSFHRKPGKLVWSLVCEDGRVAWRKRGGEGGEWFEAWVTEMWFGVQVPVEAGWRTSTVLRTLVRIDQCLVHQLCTQLTLKSSSHWSHTLSSRVQFGYKKV